ncbi:hypothetical protein JTB14_025731 [Gonioctena quinquepunctata]|nr:hypothetical protein JTB14_025731 [Gonioctena quinquepunctata]
MVESKDKKEISTHGHKSEKLTWDELQCDIPFEEKIHMISGKTIIPEEGTCKMKYEPKQQFCLYCETLVRRFGRHLTTVHKNEGEVQKIISHGKKTGLRRKLIDQLRTKGNYIFNHGDNESSTNIVARRPINKQCPKEYMDCPICFVRLSKISLRRHIRKCNPSDVTGKRNSQVDSKKVTFDLHKIADPILKEHVFPVLKNDLCSQVLRKDELVILYGNKLVAKYTSSHHHKMIRANLRYIGKYIIEMRNLTGESTDFKSYFSPKYYDHSVTAIREIAGYNRQKGEFRAPYSASAIGTILKFCCAILESHYIKSQDKSKIPQVQHFLKLLQTELSTDINKTVT